MSLRLCMCGCGKEVAKYYNGEGVFKNYRKLAKGCKKKGPNRSHGMSRTPTYESWLKMNRRCHNKKSDRYIYYGARGITVCDRWRNSFENFLEDMGYRPENKTLDRINNDGNYQLENCKWSTKKEQANNRRKRNTVINNKSDIINV